MNKNFFLFFLFCMSVLFSSGFSAEKPLTAMVRFAGTPEHFGRSYGLQHSERLKNSQKAWLRRAESKNISPQELLELTSPMLEVVKEIAPHWIKEYIATAEAAGIDPDLYLAQMFYVGPTVTGGRGWFKPEPADDCTTYLIASGYTGGYGTFFHRTRDNTPGRQTGAIWEIDYPGINKFMAVTYTGSKGISVMVNEKGLAASADMGGPNATKRKDIGMMNGLMLRYIAEKASDSMEALDIVRKFVENGWYAGGRPGTRWTFADSNGVVIDASHSSDKNSLKYRNIKSKYYITMTWGGTADKMLENLHEPVSFTKFRNISRNPEARINKGQNSIAGMTIRIHPEYPEFLTSAWFSFPATSLAFPLYMGGSKTPSPMIDGSVYELCISIRQDYSKWEATEEQLFSESLKMERKVEELLQQGKKEQARELIDSWTASAAARNIILLKEISSGLKEN